MSHHATRRRPQRGQSLVIFALSALVLFSVVGMAVDGGFSYFASDRLERGAMAAALAGVTDMPDLNSAPNDATTAALAAAAKNGWTSGGANNVAISVGTLIDPNTGVAYNNRLQVTITSDVPVFFMRLLGFGTHREARTAVAEYLRPITFGQPGSQLGATMADLVAGNNFYFMRSEGWGTDRGQGDAYGPNPNSNANGGWTGSPSSPNIDVHALSGTNGTETGSQPIALPARGGQNYQIYVPAGQTANVEVYNPVFAPDNGLGSPASPRQGYNYHEDDSDFPESGRPGCSGGNGQGPGPCSFTGPNGAQQWPIMSYTVYKSVNPFDHSSDLWLSNTRVKSIDATSAPTTGKYTIPATGTATTHTLANLTYYHSWVDVQAALPNGLAKNLTVGGGPAFANGGGDGLSGGLTGTTYRLRVDQLDDQSADPGANGRAQNQNSQAHKGYAVRALGCGATPTTICTVTALNDITLYTPLAGGGAFSMPLVSIPPEYAGHTFSLYIYDPGDVTCNSSGCSNILSVTQPTNRGATQTTAQTTDGVYSGKSGEGTPANPATWTQQVTCCNASIQTQDQVNLKNIYNGLWIRFDISVPSDYASGATPDVNPADSSTWFWFLSYTTAQPAGDTITANLGFTGAPVHLISG